MGDGLENKSDRVGLSLTLTRGSVCPTLPSVYQPSIYAAVYCPTTWKNCKKTAPRNMWN